MTSYPVTGYKIDHQFQWVITTLRFPVSEIITVTHCNGLPSPLNFYKVCEDSLVDQPAAMNKHRFRYYSFMSFLQNQELHISLSKNYISANN